MAEEVAAVEEAPVAEEAPVVEEVKKPARKRTAKKAAEPAETAEPVAEPAAPAAEKKPAAKRTRKAAVKVNLVLQAGGRELSEADAYEKAIEDWCKSGFDRADLKEIAVYVKPEEFAIYYVINGKATGRVAF